MILPSLMEHDVSRNCTDSCGVQEHLDASGSDAGVVWVIVNVWMYLVNFF